MRGVNGWSRPGRGKAATRDLGERWGLRHIWSQCRRQRSCSRADLRQGKHDGMRPDARRWLIYWHVLIRLALSIWSSATIATVPQCSSLLLNDMGERVKPN